MAAALLGGKRDADTTNEYDVLIPPTPVAVPYVDDYERPAPRLAAEPTSAPDSEPPVVCCVPDPTPVPVLPAGDGDAVPLSGDDCIAIARSVGISEAGLANAALICQYDWDWWTALSVARCESGVDLYAYADSGDSKGVFQLHYIHAARWRDYWEGVYDPAWNIAHAYEMWTGSGWGPWSCARY